ncbi:MAG: fasciclin domain-containing protein [Prolixibacteraceae bacterium]|nr:fasciclin domain-containing protein [Prolixibacteraceae bacterium]
MKGIYALRKILLFLALVFLLYNCEDDHYARYENPPWLGGTILETLEDYGNFSIFIELMKKAGYEEPITKGLYTVFAANDSSYQAYFNKKGIASIDDVSEDLAYKLFTLNVVTTPRARQQLIFDYSSAHVGWQEPHSELGALLFRINTRSKAVNYTETVRYYKSYIDQTLDIVGQEKKVPLFSTEFYEDFNGAPDGSDYTYFFPNTEWKGLQWYNASIDSIAKCSNGYVYYLDKAVPEIPNMEDFLRENQDKYGVFYDWIQRFASYSFSAYDDDADRTKLYQKSYSKISNICSENGPTDDALYCRKTTFSLFLPKDEVFREYINNTFLSSFENIDSIPEITRVFLAQSCIKNNLDIPSKVQRSYVNYYGDELPIDVYNDVDEATFLSNGPVYIMNKYYPPKAFSSTVGPIFFSNDYTTFLYNINDAQMISSITSPELEVTLFGPTNEGLLEGGFDYNTKRKRLELLDADGKWRAMTVDEELSLVGDHLITDNLIGEQIDFSGEGFVKMSSKNYIYYNNNEIQAGGNQEMGNVAKIVSTSRGDNGVFHALDKAILAPKKDAAKFIANDPDLSEFYNLLYKAGLSDTAIDVNTDLEYARISFLGAADFWTVFAPTNAAIITAQNNSLIPNPDSTADLRRFLMYHFIVDKVIFDDGKIGGAIPTTRIDSSDVDVIYFAPIEIINEKKNLSLVDKAGNTVKLDHNKANNLVLKGVLHKLDKILVDR